MKGLWKRMGSLLLTVCCALGFALIGARWLQMALSEMVGAKTLWKLNAVMCLVGAVVCTVRAVREYRKLPKPEREVADAAVNALLCLACAILWLRRFEIGWLAGLVWAIGAIAWLVRAVRRYRACKQETDRSV